MTTLQPRFLDVGEGRTLSMAGVSVTFKLESADSANTLALWDYSAPAHFQGPGAHFHKQSDEAFYVLEGTPTFYLGENVLPAAPHSFVYIPRGTVHRFSNLTETPLRMLTFRIPAGSEGYFEALIQLLQTKGSAVTPADLDTLGEDYDQFVPRE